MNIFDFINIPFAYVMRFFDGFTHNYALSLLLFAILVKLIFVPLGIKQQKNQIKQASLRPKEEVIRRKYAGRTDKATQQKMQQEIMDLYQKEHFNPMGGCLPLIIQLVVIMALYQIIRQPLTYICGLTGDRLQEFAVTLFAQKNPAYAIDVPDFIANLGSMTDAFKNGDLYKEFAKFFSSLRAEQISVVSTPEFAAVAGQFPELATLPNFDLFGLNLAVTPSSVFGQFRAGETGFGSVALYAIIPIVCCVVQFFTTRLTRKFTYQAKTAAGADASMKMMEWAMPAMSLFFCFTFSSAIGLYWIYQNVLAFAQTVILAKLMPLPTYTPEQIRAFEKEVKAKDAPVKKSEMRRVRSLHHIDDDDYDELPTVENSGKTSSAPLLNGEQVTLKDESDKKKK